MTCCYVQTRRSFELHARISSSPRPGHSSSAIYFWKCVTLLLTISILAESNLLIELVFELKDTFLCKWYNHSFIIVWLCAWYFLVCRTWVYRKIFNSTISLFFIERTGFQLKSNSEFLSSGFEFCKVPTMIQISLQPVQRTAFNQYVDWNYFNRSEIHDGGHIIKENWNVLRKTFPVHMVSGCHRGYFLCRPGSDNNLLQRTGRY